MLFNTKTNETFWDQPKLLNTLIKHYPNTLEIEAFEPDLSFYTRVSYAATQGQLSHLSVLPMPDSASLESFIYTALRFKSSLTTTILQDSQSYFGPDLNNSEAEFENLQALALFGYKSKKRLSDYDAIIEDCPHLRSIVIRLYPVDEQEEIIKFEGVINPRPNVHKLEYYLPDEKEIVNLEIDSETVLIHFTLFEDNVVELPYINFLSEAGNMISSIDIQSIHPDNLGIERWKSHRLGLSSPQIIYNINNNNNYDPGVVCMPNARLDMFVCDCLPLYYGAQENIDFYAKLKMETGVKFYERNSQTGVLAIDEQQYNQSSAKFRLEITCLSLTKLVIYPNDKLLELIP
ncbi:hypothetical protein BD770DRAFT_476965 [Pilaira anomala]|nr:hypothetical protein BD770DRAFT_476965 [Pilaira anomala]